MLCHNLILTLILVPLALFSSPRNLGSPDAVCCECDSQCRNQKYGVLVYGSQKKCQYNITTSEVLRTKFYRQSSTEVQIFYPTKTQEANAWTAPDTDSEGPSIEAFNNNGKIDIYKKDLSANVLLEYYASDNLQKNEDFLLNICFSSDYNIIYGSMNISHLKHPSSYYYLQLSNHDSSLYRYYEQLVKSYFGQAFSHSRDLKGFYNTVVFSFSPNSYLNFAIESINNPDFNAHFLEKILIDFEKSLSKNPNGNQLNANITSLQLSENTDPVCFEIIFPGSDNSIKDHSKVTHELSLAIYDFCQLIRVCSPEENPITITNYRPMFYGENGGKVNFCVKSNLVKRQIIEAILNEHYTISSQLGDFKFNYQIQPDSEQLVIMLVNKSGDFKNVAIWVIMTSIFALLVIILIFLVLFFVYKYWSSKKRLYNYYAAEMDPLANSNQRYSKKPSNIHQAALRASEMSLVVKTGPRQTFLRADSQTSLQNGGTLPQNTDRNQSNRMYVPRGKRNTLNQSPNATPIGGDFGNENSADIQDYDPLDIDYLRRSELAASKMRSSSQIAMETGYADALE